MTVSAGERRTPISTSFGFAQHPCGQPLDFGRQRRGKKQRLPVGRNFFDDPAHVRQKSHVEHAIDFIEHENVHVAKMQRALLEMIEQPPRRGDDDVHAALQVLALFAVADAAVDDGLREYR